MMRRWEQNDARIEKLMERSERREKELARGPATTGTQILDTQKAIPETQVAILAELRLGRNAGSGGGPARS